MKILRIIIIILFTYSPLASCSHITQLPSYAVVIDAGSSSSKLHVFKITADPHHPQRLPSITDLSAANDKVQPGIANFANNPDQAGPSLKLLLDKAALQITQQGGDIKQTAFFLYATAGMRLITQAQQDAIYGSVQHTLSQYPFKSAIAKTISGQQEGIFNWLTANYLLGQLQCKKPRCIIPHRHDRLLLLTNGVLDLGGASTQITYYANSANNPKDIAVFKLNQLEFSVFSHSFLGLGQDQARARTNYPSICYPAGYTIPQTNQTSTVFDWETCRNAIVTLINHPPFESNNWSVAQVVQPINNNIQYLAISGYSLTFNYFATKVPAKLKESAQQPCSNWAALKQYDGNRQTPDNLLGNTCFNAVFVYTLLTEGYGIAAYAKNLVPAKDINGQSTDWPLGAALYTIYNP